MSDQGQYSMHILLRQSREPTVLTRLFRIHSGNLLPPRAYLDVHALGIANPEYLRIQLNRIPVVILAFAKSRLGPFTRCNVHDRNGNSYDIAGLVRCGLIGDKVRHVAVTGGTGHRNLHSGNRFPVQSAPEKRFDFGKYLRCELRYTPAEMSAYGSVVHIRQILIDAD